MDRTSHWLVFNLFELRSLNVVKRVNCVIRNLVFASEASQLLLPNIFHFLHSLHQNASQKITAVFKAPAEKRRPIPDALLDASTEQQPSDALGAPSSAHWELIDDCNSTPKNSKQARIQEDNLPSSSELLTTRSAGSVESGTLVPIVLTVFDIGNCVSKGKIDDRTKRSLLLNHWKPPPLYNFPFSTHNKQNNVEKRYLKQTHLDQFKWAVYSEVEKGVFCKYCSLFAISGSVGRTQLGVLVKTPLVSFSKLTGKDGTLITRGISLSQRNLSAT